jgi:hypothetical protein
VSPRRLKLTLLLAGIVISGVVFLAWTREWFAVTLSTGQVLSVTGSTAAPATSTLALTTLVLVGALAIAGPVFRVILGILESLLGATIALSSIIAIAGPTDSSRAAITAATGIGGTESVADLVESVSTSVWPWVSAVAGIALVAAGVLVAVTSRAWPGSSRKYSTTRAVPVEGDTIGDWDALSEGNDPTTTDDR